MKQRKKERSREQRRPAAPAVAAARTRRSWRWWPVLAAAAIVAGSAVTINAVRAKQIPVFTFRVHRSFAHDPAAFCQGLLYADGILYESTGLYGRSTVRRVRLETGEVLQSVALGERYFGEGLALWKDRLIQLTWQEGKAFVYDAQSLRRIGEFDYQGEGWGLTHDGTHLIMSDGTSELRFLDPDTFRELRRLRVTADGRPIDQLNELEYIDGEVYANVWQTDFIARIDPGSGVVKEWIDLTGLLRSQGVVAPHADVLNGIAYDAAMRRLFVTGKKWPKLFELELERRRSAA
ncbi:MAG: glutaminyl-peptide cyclotransferase [Planctomycetota bacterium]